jgi:hypothetical protein
MARAALQDVKNGFTEQLSARTLVSVVSLFHIRSTLIQIFGVIFVTDRMHRNVLTCFWKIGLCFQCCLTLEMSPLVCVSCFVIVWVSRVLLSFCHRLRGDDGCWVKIQWNLRAFRSDNATASNLLLDGNIGRRGPNFNVLHTVHLSK